MGAEFFAICGRDDFLHPPAPLKSFIRFSATLFWHFPSFDSVLIMSGPFSSDVPVGVGVGWDWVDRKQGRKYKVVLDISGQYQTAPSRINIFWTLECLRKPFRSYS